MTLCHLCTTTSGLLALCFELLVHAVELTKVLVLNDKALLCLLQRAAVIPSVLDRLSEQQHIFSLFIPVDTSVASETQQARGPCRLLPEVLVVVRQGPWQALRALD